MASDAEYSQWRRLVEALDEWTAAHEVSEGRIRVWLPDLVGSRPEYVDIVMSPQDWDVWSGTVMGSLELTIDEVKQAVAALATPHPFLVHHLYELHPSLNETLPPDPDEERMAQLMRENDGRPIGNWFAYGKDGKTYPFPEGPPR